jgi:hypothetical protein
MKPKVNLGLLRDTEIEHLRHAKRKCFSTGFFFVWARLSA